MKITVNNVQKEIAEQCSLFWLANHELGEKQNGVAIAVNNVVIQKKEWANCLLKENDNILIIKATQGG